MGDLSDKKVQNFKPLLDKSYLKADGDGLYLRVNKMGRKTWLYIYQFEGRRKWFKLGTYPSRSLKEARRLCGRAAERVELGIDIAVEDRLKKEKALKNLTVSQLATEYLDKYARKPNPKKPSGIQRKSWEEDKRILDREILPKWGQRKAKDIDPRDVTLLLDGIVERAPVLANRVRSLMHLMFKVGINRGVLSENPVENTDKPYEEDEKETFLSDDEIRLFWDALAATEASDQIKRALKLVLVTGARSGEVAGLRWDEIDGHWWTLPASRSKNGKEDMKYLSSLALELIGDPIGCEEVFPSPVNTGSITVRAMSRVLRRYKFFGMEPFTPHDLRRTAASKMEELEVPIIVIAKILNHSLKPFKGITADYTHYGYEKEKRQALEKWCRRLRGIIEGREEEKILYMEPLK